MNSHSLLLGLAVLCLALIGCSDSKHQEPLGHAPLSLPPFPPDKPKLWVCDDTPPDQQKITDICSDSANWGTPADLPVRPASISNLSAKNEYDLVLRHFLRQHTYRDLGWVSDQEWRLTGPLVGAFPNQASYGVHPLVRIWYSPEVMDWLCAGRPESGLSDGAFIIKEMHDIKAELFEAPNDSECLKVKSNDIAPTSWTVMIKDREASHDGWYWANPTASGDGNPPILTKSAFTSAGSERERNPNWYPTGYFYDKTQKHLPSIVTPYNLYGAYCMNCHASAQSELTFASLDNIAGPGLRYRHFSAPDTHKPSAPSGASHSSATTAQDSLGWAFTPPRSTPAPGFASFFGDLGPATFGEAFNYRLPAETFDHVFPSAEGPEQFLTASNCIGCHDATVSNSSQPNMLIQDPDTGHAINVSPYSEWRASPMGLAGRDPIFFAQLESETNHFPDMAACIENTCLHCHGVMGQRQLGIDTHRKQDDPCRDLFAIEPPPEVKFGEPFRLAYVSQYQDEQPYARYGNLARDGISCLVCHHVSEVGLNTEAGYTGNWVAGPADEIYGPYEDVVTKPMENALGATPKYGKQMQDSGLCASCHNILLPVLNNDGTPHRITAPDGHVVTATYEQTTALEWENSVFARGDTFQSCQDCHMPKHYKSVDLAGTMIANIESNAFAPTTHRLPDSDITLTPRDTYSRHALHGINLFLNEMFQQFPLLLGIRQIDYMVDAHSTQPALITASQSMQRMAERETAEIAIQDLTINPSSGEVQATVTLVNKTGHYLPSGVGFRRMFIEFTVTADDGSLLWASGRTNHLGVILEGTSDTPLATEYGINQTEFQPHYQKITQQDQVQIYQELIKDSDGYLTTSFLRRVDPVKDNRLRPRGFDPKMFRNNPSPYIQLLSKLEGEAANDPHYYDPSMTGGGQVVYQFALPPESAARIATVSATLYSQSIPPSYLQQRFHDASAGPQHRDNIRRLYYMTSHLNTSDESAIENWKVRVASASASPER